MLHEGTRKRYICLGKFVQYADIESLDYEFFKGKEVMN